MNARRDFIANYFTPNVARASRPWQVFLHKSGAIFNPIMGQGRLTCSNTFEPRRRRDAEKKEI